MEITTCDKPQKEKPNRKKKPIKQSKAHTYMCLEEELEKIVFWWVMMMDKGTNLSMDDEPTIRGTTMSLHLGELEDLCLYGHFNTKPNPILQQSPSSFQSLYVEISTTTTKKNTKLQNPRNTTPTQQDKSTNTQQEQFHKLSQTLN